jgi:hypothetical protein
VNENDQKRWMNVHHMQAPCPSKILNLEKWIVAIVAIVMATKEVGEEMSEWMKIRYFRWNVFHLWSFWKHNSRINLTKHLLNAF